MLITEFIKKLEDVIPLPSAGYEKDALGLQLGLSAMTMLRRALICYEVTADVIDEAARVGANLILSYHPLIFQSLSSITDSTRTGALVRRLVQSNVGLYVVHTAFDSHPDFGTSRMMAEVLELESIEMLAPLKSTLEKIVVFVPHSAARSVSEAMSRNGAGRIGEYEECSFQVEGRGTFKGSQASRPTVGERGLLESVDEVRLEMVCERWNTPSAIRAMLAAHPYEEVAYDVYELSNRSSNFGMGTIGDWVPSKPPADALAAAKAAFGTRILRHSHVPEHPIRRVSMVGGAGMDYYTHARNAGADLFITADVRYHDFYRAEHDGVLLIDAGHAETERFVPQGMLRAVQKALGVTEVDADGVREQVYVSQTLTNAVRYF